ncbi:MAG: cupredoxin domain-containing protein [Thaumarchaeota archaeon]|nr:cupredoxin domain-containing protein [Nitrososphaerota archaeon]
MRFARSRGISDTRFAIVLVVVTLAFAAISLGFIGTLQDNRTQGLTLQEQLSKLQQQVGSIPLSLPVMNQTTTLRTITMTWYLSPAAHQDRFDPSFPIVNQGDTVQLTLIDNDTVAHDLVIGPPYNIVVNATVPGLVNDLTKEVFRTNATNNTPGVVVAGTPGNVSASYTFVAKYPGVYEFVCTYHAQVGMIGYLVVLPNAAYSSKAPGGHPSTGPGAAIATIDPGAGSDTTIKGFSPNTITLVIGVNNTITWENKDSSPHTVTADDNSFASSNIAPGQSFTYAFTSAGTYKYHCIYHPWMTGTVVVKSKQ